jgi:hypothetical protein
MTGAQVFDDNGILIGMKEDHLARLDLQTGSAIDFRFAAASPVSEFMKVTCYIPPAITKRNDVI